MTKYLNDYVCLPNFKVSIDLKFGDDD